MFTGLNEFSEILRKELSRMLPDCKLQANDVAKNNGVELKGIVIHKAGSRLSPQIYIDGYYEDYQDGRGIRSICAEIAEIYKRQTNPALTDMDVSRIADFEAVKDKICFRLVNYKKNVSQLQTMPHRKFLDLAIVYCISVSLDDGDGCIRVTDSLLSKWGVCEQTLYDLALKNTPAYSKWVVTPLNTVICEMLNEKTEPTVTCQNELFDMALDDMEFPFYIATNAKKMYGAAVLLYPEIARQMSRQLGNSNLYILPSSVHEVLILEETKDSEPKNLIQMVRDVNSSEVQPQEVLSDNIYFYDARNDNLLVLTE